MELLTENQQSYLTFLVMLASNASLHDINTHINLANVKIISSKLDNTGWIVELNAVNDSHNVINLFCNKCLTDSDTYGVKRYANRKSVALRVSLTGSI